MLNSVYRNDGQPAADPAAATIQARAGRDGVRRGRSGINDRAVTLAGGRALLGGAHAHTGIAVLDVDNDRDLDLVLTADQRPPVALLNDRLGVFHEARIEGKVSGGRVSRGS